MKDLEIILKHFYNVSNIPVALYQGELNIVTYSSLRFFPNPSLLLLKSILDENNVMNFMVSKDFLLSGYVNDKSSGMLIVIGPVMEFLCNRSTVYKILEDLKEPSSRAEELMLYLQKIPCMTLAKFIKHLLMLNYSINEVQPSENYMNEKIASIVSPMPDEDNYAEFVTHNSEEYERKVMSCVEFGKPNDLLQLLKNDTYIDANMGIIANDSVRAYKNAFVSSVALASRAAVRGGMDFEASLNAGDIYLRKMEVLNNYNDILELLRQMLLDYTEHTEKCRRLNSSSTLVHNVCNYVSNHIFDKITVTEIASSLGFNRSYLCRQFKLEANINLSHYISEMKIEEAKRLLQSTNKSIVEVAETLKFSSQNYFQTIFKKITGTTPLAYRIKN